MNGKLMQDHDKKYFQKCKDFVINADLDKHTEWLGMVSGSQIDAYGETSLFFLLIQKTSEL